MSHIAESLTPLLRSLLDVLVQWGTSALIQLAVMAAQGGGS